jgi:16S rRNA (guanine966-N2)-methyltransferase
VPEAGRVITGSACGLRLEAPGAGTRPISDRVKQALFAMLDAIPGDVMSRPVLDLFAGSGAMAIEALSRGAPRAVLVERDSRAISVIERNLQHTGLARRARVVRRDVRTLLSTGPANVPEAPFGLVVIDPPYEMADGLLDTLERVADGHVAWLLDDAIVVAKHFWKTPLPASAGVLVLVRRRRFGETALSVYRRGAVTTAGGE